LPGPRRAGVRPRRCGRGALRAISIVNSSASARASRPISFAAASRRAGCRARVLGRRRSLGCPLRGRFPPPGASWQLGGLAGPFHDPSTMRPSQRGSHRCRRRARLPRLRPRGRVRRRPAPPLRRAARHGRGPDLLAKPGASTVARRPLRRRRAVTCSSCRLSEGR
jgi:hypothetical protein